MTHPSSEQLSAWLDDGLPTDERVAVTVHLIECEACWAIVEVVRTTLDELSPEQLDELQRELDNWNL